MELVRPDHTPSLSATSAFLGRGGLVGVRRVKKGSCLSFFHLCALFITELTWRRRVKLSTGAVCCLFTPLGTRKWMRGGGLALEGEGDRRGLGTSWGGNINQPAFIRLDRVLSGTSGTSIYCKGNKTGLFLSISLYFRLSRR